MKVTRTLVSMILLSVFSVVQAADGLVKVSSPHGPTGTMDRLEEAVEEKGLNVFARIDHAEGAAKVDHSLRPTELLIFGHPKGGTPFMKCAQTIGIDLPMKALVWKDDSGQVWLGYNDPAFIAARHGAADCPAVVKLSKVLDGLAKSAVAP